MRQAALKLIIAQSAGVKISGRPVKIEDFIPRYGRAKRNGEEELMREAAAAIAAQKAKQNG
jgi:hypothetical protein